MEVSSLLSDKKLVCIVKFRDDRGPVPQNPAVHFQVTLHSDLLAPSKKFIRLGAPGDEVTGWQRLESLEVCEVLGELQEDGKTVKVNNIEELAA